MNRQNTQLGQCFLNNPIFAKNAVDALSISSSDRIIEIGGGEGALTKFLVNKPFASLTVVEIDKKYFDFLQKTYGHKNNISINNSDILKYDFSKININAIIGAIPYYITSPIFYKILESSEFIDKFVLIIQKEVADKIIYEAKSGLSYWNFISNHYDVSIIDRIPSSAFTPEPKVESTSLLFRKNTQKYEELIDLFKSFSKLSKFGHRLFLNPRKMLHKTFDKKLLMKSGIDFNLRPHQISIKQAYNLYRAIESDNL